MGSYRFGPFQLDVAKRVLLREGAPVALSSKAFDILLFLIERKGEVVEKDQIIKRVWPDSIVEENNLSVNISSLRKALGENHHDHQYIITHSGRGYSFVADVNKTVSPLSRTSRKTAGSPVYINGAIEPAGGALSLDSPFYIERPADEEFFSAIVRYDSIVLVKGARQVGKTSLLARGLQQAREWGARVILTDFQNLNSANLHSIDAFFQTLAEMISEQLRLSIEIENIWNPVIGPSANFERFLRREVFFKIEEPIVWGLDEIDRLFTCNFAGEVFGLFRSWHNKRALDPEGPWSRITLVMAYATEAHLFISDLNQSPFNVGTRLQLEDFTISQTADLNQRYGAPIQSGDDLNKLYKFVGGHPYLINQSLWELKIHGLSVDDLIAQANVDDGVYSDHLRRILLTLSRDREMSAIMRGIINGQPCPSAESFYRLRSAGALKGHSAAEASIRCDLYRIFFQSRL